MKALTVTEPFGKYAKGSRITDGAEIKAALKDNASSVVAVTLPDSPKGPASAKSDS